MPHTVGFSEGVTTDPARPAWRAKAPRPLHWAAWYPAPPDAQPAERFIGAPGAELFRMGAVAEDAPLSADRERWPTVLLSHGTGGMAQGLGWLGRHLAASGFIAIGVSHHGNTALEPYLPEGFICWWERAADLTEILDWSATDGPLAGRLDLDRVFAAGFSLGGYTVLSLAGAISSLDRFQAWREANQQAGDGPREFPGLVGHVPRLMAQSEPFRQSMERHARSYRDARVRAIAAIAPAPPVRAFEPSSLRDLALPVHITVGKGDAEAPHDECALWLETQNPSFVVTLLGEAIGHYVFLPEATDTGKASQPEICVDADGVDRRRIHRATATAVETLFRRVMEGHG